MYELWVNFSAFARKSSGNHHNDDRATIMQGRTVICKMISTFAGIWTRSGIVREIAIA